VHIARHDDAAAPMGAARRSCAHTCGARRSFARPPLVATVALEGAHPFRRHARCIYRGSTSISEDPMHRSCVIVADASRARVFSYESLAGQAPTNRFELEVELSNPERRLRDSELFSDTRPGLNRSASGRGYAVSDRREEHIDVVDHQFAAQIAAEVEAVLGRTGARELVLVASPRMLGHLRDVIGQRERLPGGVSTRAVPRDLTRLTASRVQDHLADLGYLDPRSRAVG
jgi:protein required for attachment to host cells